MSAVSGSPRSKAATPTGRTRTAVLVSAALDAYGSDLQLLESVAALTGAGWRVVVIASRTGRARERVAELGAELIEVDFPVLVRATATPSGLIRTAVSAARALPRMTRILRRLGAAVVYVNTLTIPWWLPAGRLVRIPTLCHVHEAEARDPLLIRTLLAVPLLLADRLVVNSRTTRETATGLVPGLRRRARLVYNGVEPPPGPVGPPGRDGPARLVVIGRISPRKSTQTALEATAILRARGLDVRLEVCGTPAPGADAFHDQLQQRAARPDLAGSVTFTGYVAPVWPALERSRIVLAPSLGESFGNAVVEAQLACRPVIATAVQGHLETISDDVTGLLVPCEDAEAMADAVARLLGDPDHADRLATAGRASALAKFTSQRYRAQIVSEVTDLAGARAGT